MLVDLNKFSDQMSKKHASLFVVFCQSILILGKLSCALSSSFSHLMLTQFCAYILVKHWTSTSQWSSRVACSSSSLRSFITIQAAISSRTDSTENHTYNSQGDIITISWHLAEMSYYGKRDIFNNSDMDSRVITKTNFG